MLNNVELTQVVDALCERLQDTELEGYDRADELILDVADLVSGLVDRALGDFGSVWVTGRDTGKVSPVLAYGADFSPEIVIGVGGFPVVAIEVGLAKRDGGVADPVAAVIGRAVVHSVQYPYVIAFVLDRGKSELGKHLFDSEIETRLWDNNRISLIVRQ